MGDLQTIQAMIYWVDEPDEFEHQTFGIVPNDWLEQVLSDHPQDDEVFYWLYQHEVDEFKVGFTNGEWTVLEIDNE